VIPAKRLCRTDPLVFFDLRMRFFFKTDILPKVRLHAFKSLAQGVPEPYCAIFFAKRTNISRVFEPFTKIWRRFVTS
jgi:hypothetical protein